MEKPKVPESLREQVRPTQPLAAQIRRKLFQICLVFLSGLFLILAVIIKIYPSDPIDLAITKEIQSIQNPALVFFLTYLSEFGNTWEAFFLPIISVAMLWWYRQKKEAFFLLISVVGSTTLSEFFKNLVARPRPDGTLIIQLGHYVRHDSFPSGHVLFFIGFFGYLLFLSYTKLKKSPTRTFLITLFSVMIAGIGLSRIYLGAHWFSDTLGSYLLGSVLLSLVVYFYRKTPKKLARFFESGK